MPSRAKTMPVHACAARSRAGSHNIHYLQSRVSGADRTRPSPLNAELALQAHATTMSQGRGRREPIPRTLGSLRGEGGRDRHRSPNTPTSASAGYEAQDKLEVAETSQALARSCSLNGCSATTSQRNTLLAGLAALLARRRHGTGGGHHALSDQAPRSRRRPWRMRWPRATSPSRSTTSGSDEAAQLLKRLARKCRPTCASARLEDDRRMAATEAAGAGGHAGGAGDRHRCRRRHPGRLHLPHPARRQGAVPCRPVRQVQPADRNRERHDPRGARRGRPAERRLGAGVADLAVALALGLAAGCERGRDHRVAAADERVGETERRECDRHRRHCHQGREGSRRRRQPRSRRRWMR